MLPSTSHPDRVLTSNTSEMTGELSLARDRGSIPSSEPVTINFGFLAPVLKLGLKAQTLAVCLLLAWTTRNALQHHLFLGGADQGAYVAMAHVLARGGDVTFVDPALLTAPRGVPVRHYVPYPFRLIPETDPPKLGTSWSKGYPALGAIAVSVFGPLAYRLVNPIAGLVSVVALFSIVRRIAGLSAALLGASLFATSWLQLFFSRYPMTEMTQQALALSISAILLAGQHRPSLWLTAIAGGLASFGLIVHYSSIILFPAYLVMIGLWRGRTQSRLSCMALFLLIALVPSALIAVRDSQQSYLRPLVGYYANTILYVLGIPSPRFPELPGAGLVSSGGVSFERWFVALRYSILTILQFFGAPIVIGSVLATPFVLRRYPRAMAGPTLAAIASFAFFSYFLAFAFSDFERINHQPDPARRFVPIVLPVTYILFALGIDLLAKTGQSTFRWSGQSLVWMRNTSRYWTVLPASIAVLGSIMQWVNFASVENVRIGEHLLPMLQETSSYAREYGDATVLLGPTGVIFDSGLRYVYDTRTTNPTVPVDVLLTDIVRPELLLRGVTLLLWRDQDSPPDAPTTEVLLERITRAGFRAAPVKRWTVLWNDIHALHSVPREPDRTAMTFTLFELSDPGSPSGKAAPISSDQLALRLTDYIGSPTMKPGSFGTYTVTVRNDGTIAIPGGRAPRSIRLAYLWTRADGELEAVPAHRCFLPVRGLSPSESVRVTCPVEAPARAGDYSLNIRVLQDELAWFDPRDTYNTGSGRVGVRP
jgi:hypothetical protein